MVTMGQKHSLKQRPQLVPWVLMSDNLLRPNERAPGGRAEQLTENGRARMIKQRIARGPVSFGYYMQKLLLDGSEEKNMPV